MSDGRFGCEKLVLVGDPKQLDPTIQCGGDVTHSSGLEQTLFDRLVGMGLAPVVLRTQYRCHPRISAVASELFYNGCLLDGVTADDRPALAVSAWLSPIPVAIWSRSAGGVILWLEVFLSATVPAVLSLHAFVSSQARFSMRACSNHGYRVCL